MITKKRWIPILFLSAILFAGGCGDSDASPADAALPGDASRADALLPDSAPPAADAGEGACRNTSDCAAMPGTLCAGPNDVSCGIPPRTECQNDAACMGDTVCHAVSDSCSPDGVGAICGPPCSADSCGDGFACDNTGHCRPVSCGAGYMCRASEVCDPASINPDGPVDEITHGCTTVACQGADDSPCPGNAVCVNGYCQDGLGSCTLPVP